MSIFSKLFSGGVSEVVDSVGNVLDKFTLSKQEKEEIKLEMQGRLMQMESEVEETYRTELETRANIIKSELAQGDRYTKRARPTIIYMGLLFIFIVHVMVPVIAYIAGTPKANMPEISLPEEFWWAWGVVVGVYGAGRSAEKLGVVNKFTQLATGSGAFKADVRKKEVVG